MKKLTTIFIATLLLFNFAWASTVPASNTVTVQQYAHRLQPPTQYDSPLDGYLYYLDLQSQGKQGQYYLAASYRLRNEMPLPTAPDKDVTTGLTMENARFIKEVQTFNDKVAAIITFSGREASVVWMNREKGRWVYNGETKAQDLTDARKIISREATGKLATSDRVDKLIDVPTDTGLFTDYLTANALAPKEYILDKLASHPLVIFGEIHYRQWSWDLMRELVKDPCFAETTAAIYLELPYFFSEGFRAWLDSDSFDPEFILHVQRSTLMGGWNDRGQFEFLSDVWHINKQLPADKKIEVVPVDEQPDLGKITNLEEYFDYDLQAHERNTHMATTIAANMQSRTDGRSGIFIVGYMHGIKSEVDAIHSAAAWAEPAKAAGNQLSQIFPRDDIFVMIPHTVTMSNRGQMLGLVRGGILDKAFATLDNAPLAFDIAGSPLASEPFEGSLEEMFNPLAGTYADNADGYYHLGPLAEEGMFYGHETDFHTGDFIKENIRVMEVFGMDPAKQRFGTTPYTELKPEDMQRMLRNYSRLKRWEEALKIAAQYNDWRF